MNQENRKSGTIRSYSSSKAYGFIDGDDGQSYFFHISKVDASDRDEINSGKFVTFDDMPTPKGMAAKHVKLLNDAPVLYTSPDPSSGFIISKSESCGSGNHVISKLGRVTIEHRDPNEAIDILRDRAIDAGCNALVNLKKGRRTGHAWTSSYKYTIHIVSAEPALVKKLKRTIDVEKATASKKALHEEIEALKAKRVRGSNVNDAGEAKFIFGLLWVIGFLTFLFIYLN